MITKENSSMSWIDGETVRVKIAGLTSPGFNSRPSAVQVRVMNSEAFIGSQLLEFIDKVPMVFPVFLT